MKKFQKIITLSITPRPAVVFNSKSKKAFWIPEDCRSRKRITGLEEDKGRPCDQYLAGNIYCSHIDGETGKEIKHTLSKYGRSLKRRVEKYNQYKDDLRDLAIDKGFELPDIGAGLMFYLPVPKRWSKTQKRHAHLTWHDQTPDMTNLVKSFEDALRTQDKKVAFYSHVGKKWVNFEQGWIEITLPSAKELEELNKHHLQIHEIIQP